MAATDDCSVATIWMAETNVADENVVKERQPTEKIEAQGMNLV